MAASNKIHMNPDYTSLPEDCTLSSLKGHWKKSLQPALNKFVGNFSMNQSTPGQQKDDDNYSQTREIYTQQVKDTPLPNSFGQYVAAYKFLTSKPKFEETYGCW